MLKLSDINFSFSQHLNSIFLSWEKYSDEARYVLVRKKSSSPQSMFDGNRIYIGKETSFSDNNIRNGEIYYYRLFILPYEDDDFFNITDIKCILRIIAIKQDEMENYAKNLYENLPSDVRYNDANLKGQNKPLWRFMNLFSYPFNKINTYADMMLNQIDIESCDEIYLPYHAKWIGQFYDEHFGTDINRLILKSVYEAEPYMGTKVGVKYILQRVFKADVNIVTDGLIQLINILFDEDTEWLSNENTMFSIRKILLNYCAFRTRFSIVSSLGTIQDSYDKSRLSDNYLFDIIYEKKFDEYSGAEDNLIEIVYDKNSDTLVIVKGLTNDVMSRVVTSFRTNARGMFTDAYLNDKICEVVNGNESYLKSNLDENEYSRIINNLSDEYLVRTKEEIDTTILQKDFDYYESVKSDESFIDVKQKQNDEYSGVKSEFEHSEIYNAPNDEIVDDYEDDFSESFIEVRPHSITCSDCMVANNFYTTDIKY